MPWLLLALALLLVIFVFGPRPDDRYTLGTIDLPDDLDGYLRHAESQFEDLVPGTEKTIVWAGAAGEKQPLSIVYLHGFSASRQEVAPLPDLVASGLEANLYYTRLTGHARTREPMNGVSVQALIDDAREALAIGQRLGERVVLVGTSTGGTLALWLAMHEAAAPIAATVVLSPNLGLKATGSNLLTAPWAEVLVPLLAGDTYSWEAKNDQHERYWMTSYPINALLPMAMLTRAVANVEAVELNGPLLALFSERDAVVDARATARFLSRVDGGQVEVVKVEDSDDPSNHVIAGDIVSPTTTVTLAGAIIQFVNDASGKAAN